MSDLRSVLEKRYDIGLFECLNDYLHLPINAMYLKLEQHKLDTYPPNYRLIFYTFSDLDIAIFYHLQKVLTMLDIPNYFVIVVSNQLTTKEQLKIAHEKYSIEENPIQFEYYEHETISIDKPVTNFNISDSSCINHWLNLEITNAGNFTPCCQFKGTIKDNNGVAFNAKSGSLIKAFSSDYMKDIRRRSLNGELINECRNCWSIEKLGKRSKRLLDHYVYKDALGKIDWNNHEPLPQSLDIKLGYTCNLACRICDSFNSSIWAAEVIKYPKLQSLYPPKQNTALWTTDEDSLFWENFRDLDNSIKYLQFTGGEPFLIKKHFSLLRYLIDKGKAKNIKLRYTSNGTIYPDEAIDIWNNFKSVEINFSIDNIGKKFEYERYGDVWENVEKNISKFLKLPSKKYTFNIFCTLSALNVADAYDVYKFGADRGMNVEYNVLFNPPDLSMNILTEPAKQFTISKLLSHSDEVYYQKIKPIIVKLQTEKSHVTIDKFWNRINLVDESRGQLFSEYYPELYKLLRN